MARKVDRPRIEAALKKAARTATNGPPSSRSGRVLATGPVTKVSGILFEHVSSTAIQTLRYDPDHRELTVTFKSGRTYVYAGVPEDVASALADAGSKGSYFNQHVRDSFDFREVR